MAVGSTLASTAFVLVATPFLVLIALVLLPIAILTTVLATATLSLRAYLVYLELFVAVVGNHFTSKLAKHRPAPKHNTSTPESLPRPRSARSMSSSSGSRTPKFEPPLVPVTQLLTRDFEGVGGWRMPAEDDESEGQWLTMNSRLELPVVSSVAPEERQRHHFRHNSSGSLLLQVGGSKRPALRSRPSSVVISGATSPETGMGTGARVKSMVQLGEARRKTERRKSSSSSSSSGRTLMLPAQTR